jgi:hypothetical protein
VVMMMWWWWWWWCDGGDDDDSVNRDHCTSFVSPNHKQIQIVARMPVSYSARPEFEHPVRFHSPPQTLNANAGIQEARPSRPSHASTRATQLKQQSLKDQFISVQQRGHEGSAADQAL